MNIKYYLAKLIKYLHLPAIKNSIIHKTSKIANASNIVATTINKYTYVGNNCTVVDTEIGSFCSIADNVIIGGASHPIYWVSTSPIFHEGKNIIKKNFSEHIFKTTQKTIIGNDVWIGNNCLIKSGVVIGTGAIIGMGSIVTKDIGPYEIWAGNPAKMIKNRFDTHTVENLLSTRWWDLTDRELVKYSQFMNKPLEFIKLYNKEKNEEK